MRFASLAVSVLLAIAGCATTDEPFMRGAAAAERERAIMEEFHKAASEALRENKVTLTPEVADQLRLIWQTGARQLIEDDATTADVARATMNARRIILIAGNSHLVGFNREVTLEQMNRARLSICPVYPFC